MDVTIKGIPETLSEQQVLEWCSVLIERQENAKIQAIPALVTAQDAAKVTVDTFRTANSLEAKFAPKEAEKVA